MGKKKKCVIATHDGDFDADQLLAIYMLKLLPQFKDWRILRSSDPRKLDRCHLQLAVGGIDSHKLLHYDYNQRGFRAKFAKYLDDSRTMAASGLIYRSYGREVLAKILGVKKQEQVVKAIYTRIYLDFIEAIEAHSTRRSAYTKQGRFRTEGTCLSAIVETFNPTYVERVVNGFEDHRFETALEFIGQAFVAEVRQQGLGWFPARAIVVDAFDTRFNIDKFGRLLVLERGIPFRPHLFKLEKAHAVLLVLYPLAGSYRIEVVRKSKIGGKEPTLFPETWWGLNGAELCKETELDGCVFVHSNGILAEHKTFEGAIEMAKIVLENYKHIDHRYVIESEQS